MIESCCLDVVGLRIGMRLRGIGIVYINER